MSTRILRSPLVWTTVGALGLAVDCMSGPRSYDGGSGGWEDEPTPPEAPEEETEHEEPSDSGAVDTDALPEDSALRDTAVEEQCEADEPVVLYMSPDDSNSMSSPSQVRSAVLGGWAELGYVTIRRWEFMNYYGFAYPPAAEGELALDMALAPAVDGKGEDWELQIGIAAPQRAGSARAPLNLTFVLDTSGSMTGDPLELSREVLLAVHSQLRPGDVISVVTWNTENNVLLADHEVTGSYDVALPWAASQLEASGATDLYGGLQAGYRLARAAYDTERINRVVLVSDGGANVGVTSIDLIGEQADDQDAEGIYLVGVGVGSPFTYNDSLMDQVTDAGKGASVFVDSAEEAWRVFSERFVNTFDVAARDVQVELVLPPGMEIVRFSGEGFSADPTEIDPQHIAPNDAMVFYNQLHTCAPEILTGDTPIALTVRWEDAVTRAPREATLTRTWNDLLGDDTALLDKGRAITTYADALKKVILAGNPRIREEALVEADEVLARAEASNPGDADLAEIRAVLEAMGVQATVGSTSAWTRLGRSLRDRPVISAFEERFGMGHRPGSGPLPRAE